MINLKSIEAHFVSGINPCVNKVPDRMRFLGNLHYEVCLIPAPLKVFFFQETFTGSFYIRIDFERKKMSVT